MEKIASFNFKGGVGKSTIAVQLAHGLAKSDYKVLLLDLDSQNNCSLFLGISEEDWNKTFFDLIDFRQDVDIQECFIKAREKLDLLPSDNYGIIEKDFHREPNINEVLEDYLGELNKFGYDYLIIDCSPTEGVINDAILYYTNHLLVPIRPETGSISGIKQIYSYLSNLKISTDKIKLIVPNQVRQKTKEHQNNLKKLHEIFKDGMLAKPIHLRTKIAEATGKGKTIYEHDKIAEKQFYDILRKVVNFD